MTTFAPNSDKRLAVAPPMPLVPPVISVWLANCYGRADFTDKRVAKVG